MLTTDASRILGQAWDEVKALAESRRLKDWLRDAKLIKTIHRCINSRIKTYRYVLPTQIVAKLADHSLDCRCLQASRGGPGAFDARTIAHKVVVPFDQANESVLGGSQEPYVNNPLRVPEISQTYRAAQKYPEDWDALCAVLDTVERSGDRRFTTLVFRQILTEIYRRLSVTRVVYPTPMRVSLARGLGLIGRFLANHSGGDRLLAVVSALFVVIGRRFGLYAKVRRGKITAADRATGMIADLECTTKKGEIVFVVEVKDREITGGQLRAKIRSIREKQVSEIFFVTRGISRTEKGEIERVIDHEFTSGHNIYLTDVATLARVALALLGEQGRKEFLAETANQLEQFGSDVSHRRAWANLLASA